jgi:hypothetical protein
MDLPRPIGTDVVLVDLTNHRHQLGVTNRPRRQRPALGDLVSARANLDPGSGQDLTDRLDPGPVAEPAPNLNLRGSFCRYDCGRLGGRRWQEDAVLRTIRATVASRSSDLSAIDVECKQGNAVQINLSRT